MNNYLQIHLSYKFELGKNYRERLVCSIRPACWFKMKRLFSLLKEYGILLRLDHIQFWSKNPIFFSLISELCSWLYKKEKSFCFQLLEFLSLTHLLRINIGHPFFVKLNLVSVDDSNGTVTDPPWETESHCLWGDPWEGHKGHLWGCWAPKSWSMCSKMAKSWLYVNI